MWKKLFAWAGKKTARASDKRRRQIQRRFLGAESLEERRPLAADLRVGINGAGDLIITDDQVTTADNQITIRLLPQTGMVEVTSGTAGGGTAIAVNGIGTLATASTVQVPYSFITGKILVTGNGGGDSLTIDYVNGDPLPAGGLDYDGQAGTDSLTLSGGTVDDVVVNYGATQGTGSIILSSHKVTYQNLDSGSTLTLNNQTLAYTLNLPGLANDNTVVTSGSNTSTQITNTGTTIVTTAFTRTANTDVTINMGASTSTLTLTSYLLATSGAGVLTVNGGAGVDTITSTLTDTDLDLLVTINGDAGNDTISGGSIVDVIFGGDGNDSIAGNVGGDIISGGAGDDTISGNADGDDISGDAGNDTLTGGTGADWVKGGLGSDLIIDDGSDNGGPVSVPDTIDGGAGDDNIQVGGAFAFRTDLVTGGSGTDRLTMTSGITRASFSTADWSIEEIANTGGPYAITADDAGATIDLSHVVYIGSGIASLQGGTGNDVLIGTNLDAQFDIISGNDGNDSIYGLKGNDSLTGGNGNDYIDGGFGNDTIQGSANNDTLYGRDGNDTLQGSTGNDLIYGDNGNDSIAGDAGLDSVYGGYGNDTINDVVNGDTSAEFIDAGGGNDTIQVDSSFNNDTLFGGTEGIDSLVLNSNITRVFFSAGTSSIEQLTFNTFAIVSNAAGSTIDLQYLKTFVDTPVITGGAGVDILTGSNFGDVITGAAGNDTIRGLNGSDNLNGGDGDDVIYGGAGNDTITGGNDSNTLANHDVLEGDAGNDTFVTASTNTEFDSIDGGAGSDTISNSGGALVLNRFTASSQSIEIITNAAANAINGNGNNNLFNFRLNSNAYVVFNNVSAINGLGGNDTITGTNVANTINGGDGVDTIYGLGGNDTLNGNDGDDYIDGGAGADTINGGDGADTLRGGADTVGDTFVFTNTVADNAVIDVILDLKPNTGDIVDLSSHTTVFGNLSFSPYTAIWYPRGTEVFVNGGVAPTNKKVQLATITNVNSVQSSWFDLTP